jgi:hypothetical protein
LQFAFFGVLGKLQVKLGGNLVEVEAHLDNFIEYGVFMPDSIPAHVSNFSFIFQ